MRKDVDAINREMAAFYAEKQARLKVRLAGTDDNGPCPCLCRKR